MSALLKIFIIYFITNTLQAFSLPENTCQQYLSFRRAGSAYDVVLRIPNDYTGDYNLIVNGSLPFQTNKRMNIVVDNYNEIITRRVPELIYVLKFDSSEAFPKITEVVFNGKQLCSAPRYPVIPGGVGVTNMWSSSIVHASVQVEGSNYNNNNYYNTLPTPSTSGFFTTTTNNPFDIRITDSNQNQNCGVGRVSTYMSKLLGSEVTEGEFPWLVAMFIYNEANNAYRYHCTCTLISSRHVITAGHCLQYGSVLLHEKENIILVLGQTSLVNWAKARSRGEVAKIDVHPSYIQDKSGHDLAILTMEKPVRFSTNVAPICLWNKGFIFGTFEGMDGVVAGWGQFKPNSRESNLANRISMNVVSQKDCSKRDAAFADVISDSTFCAGTDSGPGPCSGDSGAGFYFKINDKYYLRGLVAYTMADEKNRCDPTNYVVFADFLPDIDWINNVVNK